MLDEFIGRKLLGPDEEFFEIVEFVGKGAMGRVYRAVGETSKRTVAVKIALENNEFESPSFALRSLTNEQRMALLGIDHENVLSYLYVNPAGDDETAPYVITEFVGGGTLDDLIKTMRAEGKQFTTGEALSLMRQIAAGMKAINERVIHRDIKPGNVLLARIDNKLVPKIADFGVSKIAVDPTREETFKGIQTILYMAPEVWNQEKQTTKVDMYSVGLTFYEILLLRHPLLDQMNDPFDLHEWRSTHLTRICPNVREIRSDVDISIAELLLRMTEKRPGKRPDWYEAISILNFEKPASSSPLVDPEILGAIQRQAEERVRGMKEAERKRLEAEDERERANIERQDYEIALQRLTAVFDEVVHEINKHTPNDKIVVSGAPNRRYEMPNGRVVEVLSFGLATSLGRRGNVLAGGYVGVEGGLSANLVLNGSRENIAEAIWTAIEVIILPLFGGDRLELYRRADISDDTIRYVEYMDHDKAWRRDLPGFFGIRNGELFFSKIGQGGMDVYQLSGRDLMRTFNEILKVALKMPRRG